MLACTGCPGDELGGSEQPWQGNGQHRIQSPQQKKSSLCQAPLNPFCLAQCGLTETILLLTNGEETRLESARDGSFIFTHSTVRDALNGMGLEEINNDASMWRPLVVMSTVDVNIMRETIETVVKNKSMEVYG